MAFNDYSIYTIVQEVYLHKYKKSLENIIIDTVVT